MFLPLCQYPLGVFREENPGNKFGIMQALFIIPVFSSKYSPSLTLFAKNIIKKTHKIKDEFLLTHIDYGDIVFFYYP